MSKVNVKEVKAYSGGSAIFDPPAGVYKGVTGTARAHMSKAGNPGWYVPVSCEDLEDGIEIYVHGVFSEEYALRQLRTILEATGYDETVFEDLDTDDLVELLSEREITFKVVENAKLNDRGFKELNKVFAMTPAAYARAMGEDEVEEAPKTKEVKVEAKAAPKKLSAVERIAKLKADRAKGK